MSSLSIQLAEGDQGQAGPFLRAVFERFQNDEGEIGKSELPIIFKVLGQELPDVGQASVTFEEFMELLQRKASPSKPAAGEKGLMSLLADFQNIQLEQLQRIKDLSTFEQQFGQHKEQIQQYEHLQNLQETKIAYLQETIDRKAQAILKMLDKINKQAKKEKDIMKYINTVNKVNE